MIIIRSTCPLEGSVRPSFNWLRSVGQQQTPRKTQLLLCDLLKFYLLMPRSGLQYKTLIPRPHLMWCPWKQQKILTINVPHLCGSLKCYFLMFFLSFSEKHNCGLEKSIESHENTGITPALFLLCYHINPQSLCLLAAGLGAIIPLANQYLPNQHSSYRLGWTALLNTSIQIVICTADGI